MQRDLPSLKPWQAGREVASPTGKSHLTQVIERKRGRSAFQDGAATSLGARRPPGGGERLKHDRGLTISKTPLPGGQRSPLKGKLHHKVPAWVPDGAVFHIRMSLGKESAASLTNAALAPRLLDSVRFYQSRQRWWTRVFLLMPDHLHALLAFPREDRMSGVIADWKRWHCVKNGVVWQDDYFDHRIRDQGELELKSGYIRRNPVAKGLCSNPEEWPWSWPR